MVFVQARNVPREELPAEPATDNIALALDGSGIICECDPAAEEVLKYRRNELLGRHISVVLPQLKEPQLMENGEPTPRLRFLSHIGRRFDMLTGDGEKRLTNLFLNRSAGPGPTRLRVMIRPE